MWLEFLKGFNSELLWSRAPASNVQLQLYTTLRVLPVSGHFFKGIGALGRGWTSGL